MPWARNHFLDWGKSSGFKGFVESMLQIVMLWIQDIFLGMRYQHNLVCPKSVSGPSCVSAVFALGLFEALRIWARKKKPDFRRLFHMLAAMILSLLIVADGVV